MKVPAGKNNIFFRLAKYSFYLLIILVPFAISTITYNQSDLPKSVILILFGSLFCILVMAGIFFEIFLGKNNKKEFEIQAVALIDIPVILFLIAALLSTVFSINKYTSFYGEYGRQIGLITFIYLFFIYIFSSYFSINEKLTGKITLFMELTAAAVSIYAIMQQLGADILKLQPAIDTRPVTTIGNAVFAGGFLAIVFPISAYNVSGKKNIFLKFILPAIILGGILVTRTRSAYLAVIAEIIVSVIVLSFFYAKNENWKKNYRKIIFLSFTGITAIAILFLIAFPGNIFSERMLSVFGGADNQRWTIWRDASGVFWKYPITGPGIGTFPNAFAEFYSHQLRYQDVMRYVDNAHNNYLQILFTMGAIGLICYLLILLAFFKICLENIFVKTSGKKSDESIKKRLFFAAILTSLAGYAIYSLTNFDEISILLYFTLLLVLVRMVYQNKKEISFKVNFNLKALAVIFVLVITCFMIYSSTIAVKNISADIHFLKGEKLVSGGYFKEGVSEINSAVISWPENPVYRYLLALNVYTMVNTNKKITEATKNDLLRQAADELTKAMKNHSNINGCESLLSLVYFESGRLNEAEELKKIVLLDDDVNVTYRLNLAYYYINNKEYLSAKEQLSEVEKIGFQAMNLWFVEALYYYNTGNKIETLNFCGKILNKEPYNPEAIELQKKANLLP